MRSLHRIASAESFLPGRSYVITAVPFREFYFLLVFNGCRRLYRHALYKSLNSRKKPLRGFFFVAYDDSISRPLYAVDQLIGVYQFTYSLLPGFDY